MYYIGSGVELIIVRNLKFSKCLNLHLGGRLCELEKIGSIRMPHGKTMNMNVNRKTVQYYIMSQFSEHTVTT